MEETRCETARRIEEIARCEVRYVQVRGGAASGKTAALVARAVALTKAGCAPEQVVLFASTRSAAGALRERLTAAAARAACPQAAKVEVTTPAEYFARMLDTPDARAATGRVPRVLADFEERILMEDMKATGVSPKRLREMLKFFYKQWTELGDKRDDFLLAEEERLVHGAVKGHLVARGAMLVYELSNIAHAYLESGAPGIGSWRRAQVLVDDFQNLNRASQLVVEALASESLTVAGNVNELVPTPEPYPYPEDFARFSERHEDVRVFVLEEAVGCCAQAAAMANELARQGGLEVGEGSLARPVEDGAAAQLAAAQPAAEVRFVKWPLPNDEFLGVAGYVKRRIRECGVRPSEVYVAVPHAVWGRALAKVLSANGVKCDLMTDYEVLKGDPRFPEKCADLRAYTLLNLIADPADGVAWRSWCGFGDYLTHSNHWCRLEDYAASRSVSLVQALEESAQLADVPFLGADVLAKRYREGMLLVERAHGKHGFSLANFLRDEAGSGLPGLLEPIEGGEDAACLLARARGRLQQAFSAEDAVRIGLPPMMSGMSFDTVVIAGAVEGFYPPAKAIDVTCEDAQRAALLLQDRCAWYSALCKARRALVVSCVQKDEANTAAALGMWAHRIRMENGKGMAVLAPCPYLEEMGDAAPGFEATLQKR